VESTAIQTIRDQLEILFRRPQSEWTETDRHVQALLYSQLAAIEQSTEREGVFKAFVREQRVFNDTFKATLDRIEEQTTKTNGRMSRQEVLMENHLSKHLEIESRVKGGVKVASIIFGAVAGLIGSLWGLTESGILSISLQ
jgi:hypothetical protein